MTDVSNEELNLTTNNEELPELSENQLLRQKADLLGIEYPKNITKAHLETLINKHDKSTKQAEAHKEALDRQINIQRIKEDALKLVRFQMIVRNPALESATGIAVTAGNDVIGHVSRIIPTNVDCWHAEKIIVEQLKSRMYQNFSTRMEKNKQYSDHNNARLVPEFTIIELPPLTVNEVKDLAKQQSINGTGQSQDNS